MYDLQLSRVFRCADGNKPIPVTETSTVPTSVPHQHHESVKMRNQQPLTLLLHWHSSSKNNLLGLNGTRIWSVGQMTPLRLPDLSSSLLIHSRMLLESRSLKGATARLSRTAFPKRSVPAGWKFFPSQSTKRAVTLYTGAFTSWSLLVTATDPTKWKAE